MLTRHQEGNFEHLRERWGTRAIISEMRIVTSEIGSLVTNVLNRAASVRIASAFFCPADDLISTLNKVPDLTLVISDEFTVNNPASVEKLTRAVVRSVPADSYDGKLHAKVFLATMPDGSVWALTGSANLTQQGLFANQEACVELTSATKNDRTGIADLFRWYERLFSRSSEIDMEQAHDTFAKRSRYRLEPRSRKKTSTPAEYWAIKTTSGGSNALDHWPKFRRQNMVAIGWEDLNVNPAALALHQLRAAVARSFPHYKPRQIDFAVNTIQKFIGMPDGSIILVCRGYSPNQERPVHIYAFARITGPFEAGTPNGAEWRFKRPAVIQEIGEALPPTTVAKALGKDSLRQTMHALTMDRFKALADQLGVPIEV